MEMRVCTYTQETPVPAETLETAFCAAISVVHAERRLASYYRLHVDISFACVVQWNRPDAAEDAVCVGAIHTGGFFRTGSSYSFRPL